MSTSKEAAKRNLDVSPNQMAKANVRAATIVSSFGMNRSATKTYVMDSSAGKGRQNDPSPIRKDLSMMSSHLGGSKIQLG